MPDRNDGITTKSAWVRDSGPHGELWFKNKTPFVLSQTQYVPPGKKSNDKLEVTLDEAWSEMRTEALNGRRAWYYRVWNETKGHEYGCELFEGIFGEPCGVCNCPSKVVCKHLVECLKELLKTEPGFGDHEVQPGSIVHFILSEEGGV